MNSRPALWSLSLLELTLALLICQPPARAQSATPIRVACVGDSITEGNANPEHLTNSWPLILGRLLEEHAPGRYEVQNFGLSGATALRAGSRPYWDQAVFPASQAFQPNLVVINLGTNDAHPRNWSEHGESFAKDYLGLVTTYQGLDSKPRLWLSNLTQIYPHYGAFEVSGANRQRVEEVIDATAASSELPVIDFANPTSGVPQLFPDGLHPNTAGNELMAMAVFRALTGEAPMRDDSIRPRPVQGPSHVLIEQGQARQVSLGDWTQGEGWVTGSGAKQWLKSGLQLPGGDFHLRARLRMLDQQNSAACFSINGNVFGFEGAKGTLFRNGPQMGGLRLLHPAELLWERDSWIEFEVIRNGKQVWFLVNGFVAEMARIPGPIEFMGFDPTRSRMQVAEWSIVGAATAMRSEVLDRRSWTTPWIDLSAREDLRTVLREGPRGSAGLALDLRDPASEVELRIQALTPGTSNHWATMRTGAGKEWSDPFELPAIYTGSGHQATVAPDGRFALVYLDQHPASPTFGDLVLWVGVLEDLLEEREGSFTCRLLDNAGSGPASDICSVEWLADGRIFVRAFHQQDADLPAQPVIVQFEASELSRLLPTPGHDLPLIDLDDDEGRHVVVDREEGQYLGHVTTELLADGTTILAVYPKGHGKGGIVYKRSEDGGLTWSQRLPTPASWSTSREVPTIHRVVDPETDQKRLIMWSGLYPARLSVSEDEGASWSELEPVGEWGGIVVMGFVERLANGSYLAMFHDDGRFIGAKSQRQDPVVFSLYQTISRDGGLSWSEPETVWSGSDVHLCEPGCVRSPDGKTLAVLLRENSRRRNSYVIFSRDEGKSWSAPRELPASLTGDRHTPAYGPDGRLFICFRDTTRESATQGDWCGWVGRWEDLLFGTPGQYRIRFKDNQHRWDTTYPGVEVLPDGTFVVTTYGHWEEGQQPYILSARITLAELDGLAEER